MEETGVTPGATAIGMCKQDPQVAAIAGVHVGESVICKQETSIKLAAVI